MALKLFLTNSLFQKCHEKVFKIQIAKYFNRALIGNRDWVGFGISGTCNYRDSLDFPCPAVRFKENTNELQALREKEKGDWRKLTAEEKKTLYRASFRQTLEEVLAPTGEWKIPLAFVFLSLGISVWLFFFQVKFISGPLPKTFSEEHRGQFSRRIIDLRMDPISGVSSKWDYDKDDWKK